MSTTVTTARRTGTGRGHDIAVTILQQLGGNQFVVMTGSKNLTYDENSLTMRLSRNKAGATWMKVTLTSIDLYHVEFIKAIKKDGFTIDFKVVKEFENVYDDMLVDIFETTTGLYTTLMPRKS